MKIIANEILMMITNDTLTTLQIFDFYLKELDNHTLIQFVNPYWHPLMVKLQHFSYVYFDNIHPLFDFHVFSNI